MRHEGIERAIRLVVDLQASAEGLTIAEICRRYGESDDRPLARRTAERMLAAVERVFPDLHHERDGKSKRWRLRSQASLAVARLTREEIAALGTASAILRRDNLAEAASRVETASTKMQALLRPEDKTRLAPDIELLTAAEGIAVRPGPVGPIDAGVVETLRQAILSSRKVRLHYRYQMTGKAGFDVVRPYGFLWGHRHYLVAWSENRRTRDWRNFVLSNIERVEPLERSFVRDAQFSLSAYANRSFGIYQEKPVRVTWRFSAKVAEEVKRWRFHPTQELVVRRDGQVDVTFTAGGMREMCWHLFTWGDDVEIVRPPALSKSYRQMLRQSARISNRKRFAVGGSSWSC